MTVTPSPTATEAPLERQSGEDLPTFDWDPPGESPTNRARPAIGLTRQTLDTEHVRIHYALSGPNSVPLEDENGNGHPDYVEEVATAMEYVWDTEIEYFGWPAPPPDDGLGGDDRFDIYLMDLEDDELLGYATSDSEARNRDNPNSAETEMYAKPSYFVLENDFYPIETTYTTVAHEFMHAIQFGMDGSESQGWLWEATAMWMEEEVFDSNNEGIEWTNAVFKSPDSCQLAYGGEDRVEDLFRWYGMWIYMRYLSEQYSHQAVRHFWELAASYDRYSTWDQLLEGYDTDLETFFRDFSIALLTRDFDEGENYPTVRLEGQTYPSQVFTPTDGVGQQGADYIELRGDQPITVTLQSDVMDGVLVGIRGGQSFVFPLVDHTGSADLSSFDHTYLVVLNHQRAQGELNCHITDYSVLVELGGEPQETEIIRNAEKFARPYVEGLLDPNDYDMP